MRFIIPPADKTYGSGTCKRQHWEPFRATYIQSTGSGGMDCHQLVRQEKGILSLVSVVDLIQADNAGPRVAPQNHSCHGLEYRVSETHSIYVMSTFEMKTIYDNTMGLPLLRLPAVSISPMMRSRRPAERLGRPAERNHEMCIKRTRIPYDHRCSIPLASERRTFPTF
ncbi:hypothetical protein M405DRAFT_458556 [Rhizopogon salebrosus TDB-379]|nr:hypothetical protein M405DRAFT_458556 [Rhizopogon salebrosus TDB-379]